MKKQELALIQCEGKVKFDTFTQAETVANRKTRRNQLKPSAYHCTSCGGFHVGNAGGLKTRKPRRDY